MTTEEAWKKMAIEASLKDIESVPTMTTEEAWKKMEDAAEGKYVGPVFARSSAIALLSLRDGNPASESERCPAWIEILVDVIGGYDLHANQLAALLTHLECKYPDTKLCALIRWVKSLRSDLVATRDNINVKLRE